MLSTTKQRKAQKTHEQASRFSFPISLRDEKLARICEESVKRHDGWNILAADKEAIRIIIWWKREEVEAAATTRPFKSSARQAVCSITLRQQAETGKWEIRSLGSCKATLSVKLLKGYRSADLISSSLSLFCPVPLIQPALFERVFLPSTHSHSWLYTVCLIYETSRRHFRSFMQTSWPRIERVSVSQSVRFCLFLGLGRELRCLRCSRDSFEEDKRASMKGRMTDTTDISFMIPSNYFNR